MSSINAKMARRNIWRNPRRSILTATAIAFACILLVFMLSFQFGSYDSMISNTLKINTGHLQVQAPGYHDDKKMHQVIDEPKKVAAALDSVPAVLNYTFRAQGFALLSSKNRTYGGMVVGIDPEREAQTTTVKSLVREGKYLSADDYETVLIGKALAENLQIGLGDEITVLGQGRDGSVAAMVYVVKGLFSSGQSDFDRSMIMVPMESFQDAFSMRGAVHTAVAIVEEPTNIEPVISQVERELSAQNSKETPVALDWMELMPGLMQSIEMDMAGGFIMYFILIIVVAFSIMNTFLMAVFERTKEFGVLLALGTTPGRISIILLMESMFLTLLGIVFGVVLGVAVTVYFQHAGIYMGAEMAEAMAQYGLPPTLHPKLTTLSATLGPTAVFLVTIVTALYPALRVRKLNPAEITALR